MVSSSIQISFHCLALIALTHIYHVSEECEYSTMRKHFDNQKLVDQMFNGSKGKTLFLYSTACYISNCIITTTKTLWSHNL